MAMMAKWTTRHLQSGWASRTFQMCVNDNDDFVMIEGIWRLIKEFLLCRDDLKMRRDDLKNAAKKWGARLMWIQQFKKLVFGPRQLYIQILKLVLNTGFVHYNNHICV